ncbi:unnamed protein product [Protopolystoma xenopodis]|uniref:BRCT domain-containing protein n=1 Tax=Protopolystoma xenopodis TaxID=117903 RepID=A0A3S5A0Z3_9PLAT|nr:unnamed protein product [Protopolystoma xenopodis]
MNFLWSIYCLNQRSLVLVSSGASRTSKFLQALATLGRIPLLRHTWLLDACALQRQKPRLLTTSCDIDNNGDSNSYKQTRSSALGVHLDSSYCSPFELMRNNLHQYHLPRGLDTYSGSMISWNVVHPRFLDSFSSNFADRPFFPAGTRVVAILTDDTSVFGRRWSDILDLLAVVQSPDLYPASTSVNRLLLPFDQAFVGLTDWLAEQSSVDQTSTESPAHCPPIVESENNINLKEKRLVLVDVARLPPLVAHLIFRLPVRYITVDCLVHSLIHGRLLDPTSRDAFTLKTPVNQTE